MDKTILPHELPSALGRFPGVGVLSLDCFDTLLWRDTHAPGDIFSGLEALSPVQRVMAENRARKVALLGAARFDVSLCEIYEMALPHLSHQERQAAIAEELALEARHCFAFAPAVELMRAAKARGLGVVVVSDTYLGEAELGELIARAAGDEVAGLIDRIFCSSTHGKGKAGGLYGHVLAELKLPPEQILHIGDSPAADVKGVGGHGVNVLHLRQFTQETTQRLRLESCAASLFAPSGERAMVTAPQPHRATVAVAEPRVEGAVRRIGLTVLGPLLASFEHWLREEARELAARHGGKVHWLFVMRDGYLPMLVHNAALGVGEAPGHEVEISRLVALAASFAQPEDILHHLRVNISTRAETLGRQMLMDEAEIATLFKGLDALQASDALLHEFGKPARQRECLRKARALAERMLAHVRALADPAPGDVLMLVDLGYNGTAQNGIDGFLREQLGVHVAGRYLLMREDQRTGFDKRGLISAEHFDLNGLISLSSNAAMLDQLCSAAYGSVTDYTPQGQPIRSGNSLTPAQIALCGEVRAGCLDYVAQAGRAVIRREAPDAVMMGRKAAAAVLARFLYLPLPYEVEALKGLENEFNLGSTRKNPLFDAGIAARALRERGLFYTKGADRLYLPGELVGQGLPSRLALLMARRFGLPLEQGDFVDGQITLPAIFAKGDEAILRNITATPTHEGYYLAAIPIGDCRYTVALQFGAGFEWLQVESLSFVDVSRFMTSHDRPENATPARMLLDGMSETGPGLYHCPQPESFMLVPPPARVDGARKMLAVVFRPLVARGREAAVPVMPEAIQPNPGNPFLLAGQAGDILGHHLSS